MSKDYGKQINKILEYIDRHGVVDKDSIMQRKPNVKKIRTRKRAPRITLDLHGMKTIEAQQKVRLTFESSRNKGIREILIIHGRGFHSDPNEGPVLKKLVREMLENELRSLVLKFQTAVPRDGGEGATLVYLR
ncbi:MAG: Smr/MutS family protein [Fibrobacter sp.]|nr:Smr/MutS family protein [Fibrobacter sp.]